MEISMTPYTKENLVDFFGEHTYSKGAQYLFKKCVLNVRIEHYKNILLIEGTVRGSQKKPYISTIEFDLDHSDPLTFFNNQCSCPLGGECKHVVATLLEAMTLFQDKSTPHPMSRAHHESHSDPWSSFFESIKNKEKETQTPQPVVFLFQNPSNSPIITYLNCGFSRILKSGRYAKPTSLPYYLNTQQLHQNDLHILSTLIASKVFQSRSTYDLLNRGAIEIASIKTFSQIDLLLDTGRCFFDSMTTPLQKGEKKKLSLSWQPDQNSTYYLVPLIDQERPCFILLFDECHYIDPETMTCGPLELDMSPEHLARFLNDNLNVPVAQIPQFIRHLETSDLQKMLPHPPQLPVSSIEPKPIPKLKLSGKFGTPIISLSFLYDKYEIPIEHPEKVIKRIDGGHCLEITRDIEEETIALNEITQPPFKSISLIHFRSDTIAFTFERSHQTRALQQLRTLEKKKWRFEVTHDFPYEWLNEIDSFFIDIEEKASKNNWFDLELGVLVNGEKKRLDFILKELLETRFSTHSAIAAIDPKTKFPIQFPDGTNNIIDGERLKKMLSFLLELYDKKSNSMKLPKSNTHDIEGWKKTLDGIVKWKTNAQFEKILKQLSEAMNPPHLPLPETLQATLRNYQHTGFNWLQHLQKCSFGGILADDMGLGKTIQILTHLLAEKEAGRMKKPSLIIAPTSLVPNWVHETTRFAPSLKVLVLHGQERKEQFSEIPDHDIVLTTYPLIVRDQKIFFKHSFYTIVLDEAQYIKNSLTKSFQVLCELDAMHRFCLSGTPMENHLGELWSIFHFLNPGLLGNKQQFSRHFRNPIEKMENKEIQERLSKKIAPFLLRRTKDKVAIELPPKTELIKYIAVKDDQRDLYETIRISMLEKVKQVIQEKGLAKSQIIILDALLKMRQACCDPRLVKMKTNASVIASAKLEYLVELLTTLLDENRKILLFSSFTSMLALIEEQLQTLHVNYVKLTGQTKNRKEVIDQFQNGNVPLFLISLKAGGVGLNLTQADTVIHYDPWWNPAAERQATDRAHRIGQDKPVFVYKLITEKTIEEKIIALQQKKQDMIDHLFDSKGADQLRLSMEELEELFKPIS